jgi:hypothetical protein
MNLNIPTRSWLVNGELDVSEASLSEDFFSFQMGSNGKNTRWDQIVQYFMLLEKQSDAIKVS